MEKTNCLRCNFRHEDNGNCTAVGGFCTAIPAAHCPLLRQYLDTELTPESVEVIKLHMMGKAISEITEFNGLPIDRLRELAEADKAGRVVVPPCKVGDTVWFKTYTDNGKTCIGMQPHNVAGIRVCVMAEGKFFPVELPLGGLGKQWFLTHEEAEKTLEGKRNEGM